jgi:hypothetical protein
VKNVTYFPRSSKYRESFIFDKIVSFIIRQTETDVVKLLLCILDTIALKFAIELHKPVAMIFAVSFKIIIQRAVGKESVIQ